MGLIMRFSDNRGIHDGGLCAFHYEFISCKPVTLIHTIDSENTILLIDPLRVMGSHHETG
jgi:hypothetical protein